MKTLVVNLYSGPGAGKSTMAARVFAELKEKGLEIELVTEYAKDVTWQKGHHVLSNQIYIFAKQYHRVWRLLNQVRVIITDSPMLMCLAYDSSGSEGLKNLVVEKYKELDNLDIFLNRPDNYNSNGRNHTHEEAKELDKTIKGIFKNLSGKSEFDVEVTRDHNTIIREILIRVVGENLN